MKYIPTEITIKQCTDTGMAIVLMLIFTGLYTHSVIYFKIALPVLVVNMIIPKFFYLFAFLWFGLSNFSGSFISKVLLILIFFLFVVPVGFFRRIIGKDALLLGEFKKSRGSVMKTRNHKFTAKDLEHPY